MLKPLQTVTTVYEAAYKSYKAGSCQAITVGTVGHASLTLLQKATVVAHGTVGTGSSLKNYDVLKIGASKSRPINQALFISDPAVFKSKRASLVGAIDTSTKTLYHPDADSLLYTCVMSFAACYDLYNRLSRKTPGTFLEVMMGSFLQEITGLKRGTQISIPGSNYKVTTDIFLEGQSGKPSLVIPTKMTTRERIVQAFAHQRILDDIFQPGTYKSVLVAANEMQLEDKSLSVNEICVPGQVLLFQKHLARMYGLYYLDAPLAYLNPSITTHLPVKQVSELLSTDLPILLS